MNTNEFYKELFEKYALDEEKIRIAAVKQAKTPPWKRAVSNYWKSAAGVAAAVAVTVGAVAYTAANSPRDINVTVSPAAEISAAQRLRDAERNYFNPPADEEEKGDIYVSFKYSISYGDMAIAFSALNDSEEIDIMALYTADGSVISDPALIEAFAEERGNENSIDGVKLCAPLSLFCDIQNLSAVSLAEIGSEELNDETFTPMSIRDIDPLVFDFDNDLYETTTSAEPIAAVPADTAEYVQVPQTTAPVTDAAPPAKSETSEAEDDDVLFETDESTDSSEETTAPAEDAPADNDEKAETSETSEEDPEPVTAADEEEAADDTEGGDPDADTTAESDYENEDDNEEFDDPELAESGSSQTETETSEHIPVTETAEERRPGLMTGYYSLNIPNSLKTITINEQAVVLTKDSVYICSLGGALKNSETSVYNADTPQFAWSDGNILILTGCGSSGLRDRIIVANTVSGGSCMTDLSSQLGGAEIGTVNYSESDGRYFIKAVRSSETIVYEADIDSNGQVTLMALFSFEGTVSLGGFKNGKLYFSACADNVNSTLCSFDCTTGETVDIAQLAAGSKIKRSAQFGSFAVMYGPAYERSGIDLFDISGEKLVSVDITAVNVLVADVNATIYIKCDEIVYRLNDDGSCTECSSDIVSFEKPIKSNFEVVDSDAEKVVVAEKNPNIW